MLESKNSFRVTSCSARLQRGVVLFIALIALVVMSLAAVGLIRSVDTGVMIAGNLGYKQSATIAADNGLETAIEWLNAVVNPTTLEADNAAQGYYATQVLDPTTLNWDNTDSRLATGASIVGGQDTSGNTIRYIVQRMCRNVGAADDNNCLFTSDKESLGSSIGGGPPPPAAPEDYSPVYRVTARVEGAKNTESYIQAYVY
jgi:type IV pilus assembly protein PilX